MSQEYYSDAKALSQLYAHYQHYLWQSAKSRLRVALAEKSGLFDKQTFNTTNAKLFCKLFNMLCCNSFTFALTEMQDYNQAMISKSD